VPGFSDRIWAQNAVLNNKGQLFLVSIAKTCGSWQKMNLRWWVLRMFSYHVVIFRSAAEKKCKKATHGTAFLNVFKTVTNIDKLMTYPRA